MTHRAVLVGAFLCLAFFAYAQDQSGDNPPPIPENPDSLFGPSTGGSGVSGTGSVGGASTAASSVGTASGQSTSSQASETASPTSGASTQSPESMFQGGMVQSLPTNEAQTNKEPAQALLTSQGVQIGGQIDSTYTAYGTWGKDYPDPTDIWKGFTDQFVPTLQGTLFFDARPDQHFRVFGKAKASYPFQIDTSNQSTIESPLGLPAFTQVTPNIDIFELYSDFDYKNKVYLRVGKQVVNWGVGYFFSPADVISLTPVDPQNPTIEREGPVALKMNIPFAEVDNLYMYLIADKAFESNGTFRVNDIAVAPKAEFVIGDYEIGVGGYYQRNQRPKAMMTASGSIGKIGVFGEAVLSKGADKTLVQEVSSGSNLYETYTDTTTPYFTGTAGFSYVQSDWHLAIYGQYLFNGQGYADANLEKAAYNLFAQQAAQVALTGVVSQPPQLTLQDLQQPGRNYGAAVASWSDIRDSNVTLSLFWEGNFTDGSGVVSPSISYQPFDHATLTAATHIAYGDKDTEFVGAGRMSVSLSASLGSGSF